MIENEITLIIGGEMNGTVGTSGQLAGATSWQLRRATSRLGARPVGIAVLTCVGRTDPFVSCPRTWDCFVNLGTNRFDITADIASVDTGCGRMKELVVPLMEVFAL